MLTGKRALVVEDEGITQIQIRKMLLLAGVTVVGMVATGEEAVAVAMREQPDIILMDINMPGEINGLEAARRILQVQLACIVMLSAYDEEDYKQGARDIGASGYAIKPITARSLLPEIENAFLQWSTAL